MPKASPKQDQHPLVGRFFHRRCDHGYIQNQGHVVKVGEGVAIVEWFSWVSGDPNGQAMVALSEMHGADTRWTFYGSAEEMGAAYDRSRKDCPGCAAGLRATP